jgi:hypothetical protein
MISKENYISDLMYEDEHLEYHMNWWDRFFLLGLSVS